MKDPSRRSTSPSIINEDVIMNGHSHEDDNPFAEYMWMENEEEFNRQVGLQDVVSSKLHGRSPVCFLLSLFKIDWYCVSKKSHSFF